MQYGLMAQQILSIDFDLLEKTINEYYAKAHAFYLKSVKDCQLDSKEDKEKQKMADLRNLAVSIYEKVDKLVYGDMVKAIVDSMEDAATRFAKIEKTIDELLADNPKLTTLDINRILYRQFGTRIHKGTVSWSGETIRLSLEVTEQLRQNYLVSSGLHPSSHTAINKNSLPQSIVHSCAT